MGLGKSHTLDALAIGHLDHENGDRVVRVAEQVCVIKATGRWIGTWVGRIAVRANGQHRLTTPAGRFHVSHRNLRLLQMADGYTYATRQEVSMNGRLGNSVERRQNGS